MTATAGYLFEGADWDFSKLQHIHDACEEIARSELGLDIYCACRKSNPDILVVQPAENWAAKNVPGPLDGARDRRILLQG